MSDVYFFTDQNRTLGPYGGCNASTSMDWVYTYQGLSEKILLTKGSLSTQVTVKRSRWIGSVYEHYIAAIEPGKISD